MGGVEALVAERAADLVDPVDTADHRLLEVELEGDAQQHLLVEGVEVGAERPRRRAAVGQLEDRGLDLEVAAVVERARSDLSTAALARTISRGSGRSIRST